MIRLKRSWLPCGAENLPRTYTARRCPCVVFAELKTEAFESYAYSAKSDRKHLQPAHVVGGSRIETCVIDHALKSTTPRAHTLLAKHRDLRVEVTRLRPTPARCRRPCGSSARPRHDIESVGLRSFCFFASGWTELAHLQPSSKTALPTVAPPTLMSSTRPFGNSRTSSDLPKIYAWRS